MLGTIVNTATVITGSLIGLTLHKYLPEKITKIVFQALGLFTLFLGFKMALQTEQMLVMVVSLVLGGITGELLKLEERTEKLGDKLKSKLKSKNEKFTEGLMTAFLMFCIGSMTILGALEEGIKHDPTLLLTKSVMDGFSSIMLAAGLGIGVLFAAIPLFLYQGGLTLLASWLGDFISQGVITEISATGGVLLIGLGINILELKKIKVLNLLPALVYVAIIMSFM